MFRIVVCFSHKCHTCFDHIKKLQSLFDLELIDMDENQDMYEIMNIEKTPTTILYKKENELWRKEGMFFDSQINDMRKMMK